MPRIYDAVDEDTGHEKAPLPVAQEEHTLFFNNECRHQRLCILPKYFSDGGGIGVLGEQQVPILAS